MTTIWEIDFYSRPIVDEDEKKVWEVLVCESPIDIKAKPENLFRYAEYCSNAEVNSVKLKEILSNAIAQAPNPPDKIRFFRQAMNNMITKACTDLGVPVMMSRRTYALNQWMQQRLEQDYPKMPGFQPGANPTVSFGTTAARSLPDALQGQKWALVTLPALAFDDLSDWDVGFGESFPLSLAGLTEAAVIPGLVIFSDRATPLAAWMSGLELGYFKFDSDPPRLLLETGVSDRWILADLVNASLQAEATNFETAKQQAKGVHFLAVQSSPDVESFAGFWLLQESNLA